MQLRIWISMSISLLISLSTDPSLFLEAVPDDYHAKFKTNVAWYTEGHETVSVLKVQTTLFPLGAWILMRISPHVSRICSHCMGNSCQVHDPWPKQLCSRQLMNTDDQPQCRLAAMEWWTIMTSLSATPHFDTNYHVVYGVALPPNHQQQGTSASLSMMCTSLPLFQICFRHWLGWNFCAMDGMFFPADFPSSQITAWLRQADKWWAWENAITCSHYGSWVDIPVSILG